MMFSLNFHYLNTVSHKNLPNLKSYFKFGKIYIRLLNNSDIKMTIFKNFNKIK